MQGRPTLQSPYSSFQLQRPYFQLTIVGFTSVLSYGSMGSARATLLLVYEFPHLNPAHISSNSVVNLTRANPFQPSDTSMLCCQKERSTKDL